jgi:hypothetical protein
MKRKHRKNVPLEVLQEKARQRTFEALKDFEIPLEIRDKVVLGVLFDGDFRVFDVLKWKSCWETVTPNTGVLLPVRTVAGYRALN